MTFAVETIPTSPPMPTLQEIAERAGVPFGTLRELCEPTPRSSKRPAFILDTAWSYLWRTEPGAVCLMLDPLHGLAGANEAGRAITTGKRNVPIARQEVEGIGTAWACHPDVWAGVFPASSPLMV